MNNTDSVFKEIESELAKDGSLAKGLEAVYEFRLDEDEANIYQLKLDGENSKTEKGEVYEPDCTLRMSSEDFIKMSQGELNGTSAFMSGRLKIKGNMGLALKLQDILQSYNKQKS